MHRFTPAEARWYTDVTAGQYQHWLADGIVSASVRDEPERPFGRQFSFLDLVAMRAVKLLRDEGIPLDELRKVQPWVVEHVDPDTFQVSGSLYVVDQELATAPFAPSDVARPVDFDAIVGELVWKIEHRRELQHQVGQIERNRRIHGGEPVIAGTRVTVSTIRELHDAGFSVSEIQRQYPDVEVEDIKAALRYGERQVDPAAAD
jgi:uncharacterized protein (DUF433 family)